MAIDFLLISARSTKTGVTEIYPKFIIPTVKKSSDLMIRGGDFYAIWIEELGLWSTDEQDALRLIDNELEKYAEENRHKFEAGVKILHMWDSDSGMVDRWHKYCQKQLRDSYHMLDEKLIFSNHETKKKDYASKKLNYPLEAGDISAYDKLISTLYSKEERHKLEWAIGSVVSGESKKLEKFVVLYGAAGTGKSTMIKIVQQLFEGYYSVFDAKALGSSNGTFALEAFRSNPLVAIQHDGDLSKIEDNTRLNSLVSHEMMTVNEKFKSTYANNFKCFLFMGTNKPVKITDAKSGLIRRLIDISPSGNRLGISEYNAATKKVAFELGAIAHHCREVYLRNPGKYDDYIPVAMLGASNDFYNFVVDSYHVFQKEDGVSLKAAWEMYKTYCEEAKVPYPYAQRIFKEELKNYFRDYKERFNFEDGSRARSYYDGFRTEKFDVPKDEELEERLSKDIPWLSFNATESIFDKTYAECPAQYATTKETPARKWDSVKTTLSSLDTARLHYVRPPLNHIVIDFDITGEDGEKNYDLNLAAANKLPATYAELSKSGAGIHLHYIYSGEASELSRVYDDHVEIKAFTGNSSLRRKLTRCNDLPIATISSGLPKGESKVVNFDAIKSEKGLRTQIKRNLNKEIHAATKPSIDFIYKILEDAYASGLNYDVTDMRNAVLAFAASSSNQSDYCIKLVNKMQFKSADISAGAKNDDAKLIFYDVEVFPNLFLVNWKIEGEGKPVVRMINPKPCEIEELIRFRLVGFNCRRYDNHILYARMMGYTEEQLYNLSKRIIEGSRNCFFGEAYNISYTDVFDFASAGNKKSLKKFEIELGIHHQELGLPWDEPVPPELWPKVAEYCDNDVIATEATFKHLSGDWAARQILADLAGMTVNDTTNTLTTKIIFGNNRKPQGQFNYRNMGEVTEGTSPVVLTEDWFLFDGFGDEYTVFDERGRPIFPGYKYENGKSTYRGEEVGEGGYVYAEPGIYVNVALLDVVSMHPSSIIAEVLFGEEFTRRFKEIVDGRVSIKHEAWDIVSKMLDGKLDKYISMVTNGELTSKQLADALKTAINSVYGLTSASFENAFHDPRNKDNIVAKRGALFMINLKHEVQKRGFIVAHIKTDSIKIPNATPEIIQFVSDYGKQYGYTFEHEATYDRMCLVNDAVYIAKFAYQDKCMELYGYVPDDCKKKEGKWSATGTQFAVPYVFKTLFSRESIGFSDMCETKSVTSALYLDMNESLPDVSESEETFDIYVKEFAERGIMLRRDEIVALLEEAAESGEVGLYPGDAKTLQKIIDRGHDYHFIGKVGNFCPIKPGHGGGLLLRSTVNKKTGETGYAAATGSKGYRWLEAEMVAELGKEDTIDRSYYDKMVDNAVKTISAYGDFEWFLFDEPYVKVEDDNPPWLMPCGDELIETCYECPHFHDDQHHLKCDLGHELPELIINKIEKESIA